MHSELSIGNRGMFDYFLFSKFFESELSFKKA